MSVVAVLTSGGIKSAVAAARAAKEHEVVLVHINYGQPAASREAAALDLLAATMTGARIVRVALPYMSQLRAAPADAAPAASRETRGIVGSAVTPSTIPPAVLRGLTPVLLSVGVQAALRFNAEAVVTGLLESEDSAHLGLPGGESPPGARREFIHAFNVMSEVLLRPKFGVRIETPLMDLRYAEVVKLGARFHVPFDKTWTCERFGTTPCGACEPCRGRSRAFSDAGLTDPGWAADERPAATHAGPH